MNKKWWQKKVAVRGRVPREHFGRQAGRNGGRGGASWGRVSGKPRPPSAECVLGDLLDFPALLGNNPWYMQCLLEHEICGKSCMYYR